MVGPIALSRNIWERGLFVFFRVFFLTFQSLILLPPYNPLAPFLQVQHFSNVSPRTPSEYVWATRTSLYYYFFSRRCGLIDAVLLAAPFSLFVFIFLICYCRLSPRTVHLLFLSSFSSRHTSTLLQLATLNRAEFMFPSLFLYTLLDRK